MSFPRFQQRFAFWWLALALVLAPALGRMHQVVHAPLALGTALAGTAATATRLADAARVAVQGSEQAVDVPHGLFASHAVADCLLLDQQLLGGTLLATPHAAPQIHALPHALPALPATARVGKRRLWASLARAPPVQA